MIYLVAGPATICSLDGYVSPGYTIARYARTPPTCGVLKVINGCTKLSISLSSSSGAMALTPRLALGIALPAAPLPVPPPPPIPPDVLAFSQSPMTGVAISSAESRTMLTPSSAPMPANGTIVAPNLQAILINS